VVPARCAMDKERVCYFVVAVTIYGSKGVKAKLLDHLARVLSLAFGDQVMIDGVPAQDIADRIKSASVGD